MRQTPGCGVFPVCRIWQMWPIFSKQHKVTAPKVFYNHYHLHVNCVTQTDPKAEYFEEEFIFDILSAGCKKYNIFWFNMR